MNDTDALISECGLYRYWLTRVWGPGARALFVMLNPSTADAKVDDPTIAKCCGFAERWGLSGIAVVNLYAWRETRPARMWAAQNLGSDIIGPDNDKHINRLLEDDATYTYIVAAWGASIDTVESRRANALHRAQSMTRRLRSEYGAVCLGKTRQGHPRHPGRIAYDTKLISL